MKLILTCEHASNALPEEFRSLFFEQKVRLLTHEGFDIGAFDVYNGLKDLAFFSSYYPWSRLLIEVNRSLHHPQLFSNISKLLDKTTKNYLISNYYHSYRNQLQQKIGEVITTGEVVMHLSIHSFTPLFKGIIRDAEFGILYDPGRRSEVLWAEDFKRELKVKFDHFKIRKNYPYLGKADGFTTHLRKMFPENYLGIELEINQKLFQKKDNSEYVISGLRSCLQSLI